MANQPPAGRWMRMATFRPVPNPTQDPPSPQAAAPRPVLGRTFTAIPFRPAVPTAPTPATAMPSATVTAPPRQVTPTLPAGTTIRPASVRLVASTNGIPPPQGAPNTTSASNSVLSPRQTPTAAVVTNVVPSPQQAPNEIRTANGVPSPQQAPNAAALITGIPSAQQVSNEIRTANVVPSPQRVSNEIRTATVVPSPQRFPNATMANGALPQQSTLQAATTVMPNVKPSPQPAVPSVTVNAARSPQTPQVAPSAGPAQKTAPMNAGKGTQQLLSPQVKSPPAPPTSTNITSPKASYTTQFHTPTLPYQQSPKQPSSAYHSTAASPSPQKQPVSPQNFTSTTSASAPRTVAFSNIQSSSPTKTQLSPAAFKPQILSPNTSNPADRTPPQSPKTTSLAPPPSPIHLPPPRLRIVTEQYPKIPQEPEQKSILFQQTSENHKPSQTPNQKNPQINKHETDTKPITKERHHQHHKKHPESNDANRSIITIAGENRGAQMNLSRPRTTPPHLNPQFPNNPHNPNSSESYESSGSGSGSGKPKPKDTISAAMKSFMNSNVQGINNSIMFNSTVTHHNPGVYVALSRQHKGQRNGGLTRHYNEDTDGQQS